MRYRAKVGYGLKLRGCSGEDHRDCGFGYGKKCSSLLRDIPSSCCFLQTDCDFWSSIKLQIHKMNFFLSSCIVYFSLPVRKLYALVMKTTIKNSILHTKCGMAHTFGSWYVRYFLCPVYRKLAELVSFCVRKVDISARVR